jgi:beta-glucosidase-like glycosyl hydrolase
VLTREPTSDFDRSQLTVAERRNTTDRALRSFSITVDLAPPADVERLTGSFLRSRAFGSDAMVVATLACQFGDGIVSQGVAFTLRHFPGPK